MLKTLSLFSLFFLSFLLSYSFAASPSDKKLPNQIPLPFLPNNTYLPGKTYILTFYTPWCQDSSSILSMMLQLQQEYQSLKIDSVLFYKVDGTKEKALVKEMDIRGFPSIRIINLEKWGEKAFEYVLDLKIDEFQYFLERELFGIIPHFDSFQHFEANQKEYQIVLSADKNLYPSVYQDFFTASQNNSLYMFNTMKPLGQFYKNYFIPLEEDEINNSCWIILLQRPNNFDKRLHCKFMLEASKKGNQDEKQQLEQQFKEELDKFIKEYQKPWMFFKFNHKIRQFILEHNLNCIALFSRKKTKQIEKTTRDWYLNGTRDLRYDLKHKTQKNFLEFYESFAKQTQFFYLDTEKTMERRLAHFLGIENQEIPLVVAFYFDQEKKQIIKYKSLKSQFYYMNFIPEAASALHPQNQEYSSFKRVIEQEETSGEKKPGQIKKTKSYVWKLNYYNIEKYFSLKIHDSTYSNIASAWIIIYTASFCIHSKKIDVIFQSLADKQLEIFDQKVLNINFGRAEIYGQDLPTKYGPVPDKVPEIRFYQNEKNYTVFELSNKEKISEMDLVKQIIEINPNFIKSSYKKLMQTKKKDEL